MGMEVVQDNLRDIAIVSGISVAGLVSLFAIYKKLTRPGVRSARKNLKHLVRFLNAVDDLHNAGDGIKPLQGYTLGEVSILIVDRDICWKGKRK